MKIVYAALAILALVGPAWAQTYPSAEVVATTTKSGKWLHADELAGLMREAEVWCYNEENSTCQWSEIYLDVTLDPQGITYDSTNSWDSDKDLYFVDKVEFRDDRYICEFGYDKVASTRAIRSDGTPIVGRELQAVRDEVTEARAPAPNFCYDYTYGSYDAAAGTMSLTQRQYLGGVVDPSKEAGITLFFRAADAAALKTAY